MKNYTFISPDPTLQSNLMALGWDCGQGWYPLIEELFDKIQKLVDNNSKYNALEIIQVKEKYGELKVYTNAYWEVIEDLIDKYTRKSKHICEWCGKKGKLHNDNGWLTTLCNKCHKEKLNKMQ